MKKILLSLILLSIGFISAARAQTCTAPAANMISWWRGEGNAQDARNLRHGTLQNGATFANGRVGQAFAFDGVDDAILLGNQSGLQPNSITIESWIRFDSVAVGEIENIFAKWGFDATVDSYLLGVYFDGTTNRLFGAIGDGSTGDSGLFGGDMSIDVWTHVAMTYNAADGVNKLYVNGFEVASRLRPNGIFPTVSNAYFARQDAAGRIFSGLIDELAVYSRALSQTEIQAIFNAGTAGKCFSNGQLNGRFAQKQKLLANPAVSNAGFGNAVAISGDTMVVGSSWFDTSPNTGINIGKAYVFVRSGGTWVQQAELQANDRASGDEFGQSVAISGETIVVGSYRSNAPASNSGAAYVFVRSGTSWTQQQKITANDGAADDEFGNAVAINGDTIAVGSHSADQPSGNGHAGAVYIFNRSGTVWTQAQKLIPNGTVLFGDFLGESVAISGDTLVAGASGDQEPSRTNRGTIYVYTRSGGTWSQQQKLIVPDNTPSTQLGSSVAIDGDTVISGALGDTPTPGQPNHGSVYVFVRSSGGAWTQQQKLNSSDAATSDYFGWSVAVSGNTIAVGARYDDTTTGVDAGSAYVFTRGGSVWTEKQKLTPNDAATNDRFGISAALSGDGTLVIGAAEKNLPNGQGNGAGAAYVFNIISKFTPFDFDGDAKTDIGIFRPSDGSWWYSRSADNSVRVSNFGNSTDVISPGDFTGDGKADIAIFRPASGEWFVQRSEDNTFFSFPFGTSGDVPVPSDYDGDGKTDAAVFRPSAATWFILNSGNGSTAIVTFGANGDKPVNADYDGDGKTDIAIFRPSDGSWWYLRSSDSEFRVFRFGLGTDKPVQGDYTGDGKADIAVFRASTGEWFFQRSEDNSYYAVPFGTSGDVPAPGDYDGDGKFDTAVFRPSAATWYVNRSTAGILITSFGTNGDRPIPNAFVP